MHLLVRHVLALLGGACLWLAFPDTSVWALAPVGVAAVTLATRGVGLRVGAWLGLVAGLAWMAPLLRWSGIFVGAPPWLALATLQALYVALLGAGLAALQSTRWGRAPAALGLLGGCLWVAMEALRSTTPFGGFPWGRIAFSQADAPVLGVAPWLGAVGVSWAVAVAGGLLAHTVAQGRLGVAGVLTRTGSLLAAVAVLGLPALTPRPVEGVRDVQVAAVQGNAPDTGLDFNAQARFVLGNHVGGTEQLARDVEAGLQPQPDAVFWPENASDVDPLRDARAALAVDRAVRAARAPVLVGAVLDEPYPRVTNATLVYAPGQGLVGRYAKQHPVPFAEYIPYRSFFRQISSQVDLVTADFAPGEGDGLVEIPLASGGTLPIGVGICFEVAYDELMRGPVREGAQMLFVPTNNATFGYTNESTQQLAISRVRAVELGRSVVHVSTVGVSALITPDGVVHDRTGLFTAARLHETLPARTELTWAARLGRAPEIVLSTLGGGAALLAGLQGHRRRGPSHERRMAGTTLV